MKYVLGLSFEFKYYKNPANIKIFSNNQLIDDIDLTEDIKMRNTPSLTVHENTPQYNWHKKWKNIPGYNGPEIQIPDKGFIYALDETVIQNSIKIEITNNNTNYSNGFMTHWSSFTFHEIFLIPTYYLNFENYVAFTKKLRQIRNNIPKYPTNATETYSLIWPNESRIVKNGIFTNFSTNGRWRKWKKGGSFSIELPIIEYIHEKGLKMLGPMNYEQLTEKERRYLVANTSMPLFFEYLKLINTQNEAT